MVQRSISGEDMHSVRAYHPSQLTVGGFDGRIIRALHNGCYSVRLL